MEFLLGEKWTSTSGVDRGIANTASASEIDRVFRNDGRAELRYC